MLHRSNRARLVFPHPPSSTEGKAHSWKTRMVSKMVARKINGQNLTFSGV